MRKGGTRTVPASEEAPVVAPKTAAQEGTAEVKPAAPSFNNTIPKKVKE